MDSPTLQLSAGELRFSVWLDDSLIYTDCPELDNRIGYLRLPMNEWFRNDPITISLPADYWGKTLTIAQSFPEWSETGRVLACPTTVRLYCGYAYESSLISETTQTTLLAALACLVTLILLAGFGSSRDWSILCLALVAFLWMVQQLLKTSFYYRYFGSFSNSAATVLPLISSLFLLFYLILRGSSLRKYLYVLLGICTLSVAVNAVTMLVFPYFSAGSSVIVFLTDRLPFWLVLICLTGVLISGTLIWRKENQFYRVFIPLSIIGIVMCWAVEIALYKDQVWANIIGNITSGQALYLYSHTFPGVLVAALITSVTEAVQTETNRRAEQRLMEQRKALTIASYENLRRQHEEVMMLRHDMKNHYIVLRELSKNPEAHAYIDKLIQDNEKIRPVIQSGNNMFDIILNSKINTAVEKGIHVEIIRADIVRNLPIPDTDLCSLTMNLLDNAIAAASQVTIQPEIELDMHVRGAFFVFSCTNSIDPAHVADLQTESTLEKHGMGLKIVQNIADRYDCLMQTSQSEKEYHVTVAIPLDQSSA